MLPWPPVRPPVDTIQAPPFPAGLPWVNVAPLRMDRQLGRPVLVEFWDFCRVNSLRTLPYLQEWHRRYADGGLRVIGVHSPGFPPSRDEHAVRDAVARLGVEADHVVFGHTHRSGPWPPRDDTTDWVTPAGTRLWNSGCWLYSATFLTGVPYESPYWPGVCIRVGPDGDPEPRRLLGERGHAELRTLPA